MWLHFLRLITREERAALEGWDQICNDDRLVCPVPSAAYVLAPELDGILARKLSSTWVTWLENFTDNSQSQSEPEPEIEQERETNYEIEQDSSSYDHTHCTVIILAKRKIRFLHFVQTSWEQYSDWWASAMFLIPAQQVLTLWSLWLFFVVISFTSLLDFIIRYL